MFRPDNPPEDLRAACVRAEDVGLDEVWLWEDCFLEGGVSTAAMALAWTSRLRVGIGLLPVPLRNPALTAMELATLARAFPGRLRPALGHGVLLWMEQVGARVRSPLTLLGEHTTAIRALLEGEPMTVEGEYVRLHDVRLGWPPPSVPELLIGATGPKTLELSGALADGTVLTSSTGPAGVRAARSHIDAGRTKAGVERPHDIVCYVLTAFGDDAEARVAAELASFDTPADPQAVAAYGDAASINRRIAEFIESGVTTVVLEPLSDEPDLVRFVEAVDTVVRPTMTAM